MAAGKQDSRQKMINMMYLVFIAMLALNISKEVLATLGLLNDDIESTIAAKDAKSQKLYDTFSSEKNDPSYIFPTKYAQKIKEASDSYYNFIEDSLKNKLLIDKESGKNKYLKSVKIRDGKRKGEIIEITDYQTMDKSNDLDMLFFDGDNILELGQLYISKFKAHSNLFRSIIDSIAIEEKLPEFQGLPHDFSRVNDILKRVFTFQDTIINSNGTTQKFLEFNFKGFPKIASLSKFTKLQSDIKELELQMVEALNNKIKDDGNAVNENTSKTLLDSQPSYFVGQRTEGAKIIVGRIAGNFVPDDEELFIDGKPMVKGTDYEIGGGAININKIFRSAGEKKITGNLFFREANGELTPIPVEHSLIINNKTDFFVELPRMNILYRGVPNIVRINDPEILTNNLRISARGANIKRDNQNTFKVSPNSLDPITVIVSDASNPKVRKTKQFRVKELPKMESAIVYNENAFVAGSDISIRGLQRGKISANIPDDFFYDLSITVTSFDFSVGNSPTTSVKGDNLGSFYQLLQAQRPGSVAIFSNVVSKAVTSDGDIIENVKVNDFYIKVR